MCTRERERNFSQRPTHNTDTQALTLRVRAAGDADRFVIHLQTDGARELTLDALGRCSQRAWAAAGLLLLLLLLAELCARRDKAPKHRHHGERGRFSSCRLTSSLNGRGGYPDVFPRYGRLAHRQQFRRTPVKHGAVYMSSIKPTLVAFGWAKQYFAVMEKTCQRSKHWDHCTSGSVNAEWPE